MLELEVLMLLKLFLVQIKVDKFLELKQLLKIKMLNLLHHKDKRLILKLVRRLELKDKVNLILGSKEKHLKLAQCQQMLLLLIDRLLAQV